jgi:uncharacterized protein (TIGR03545 family)
MRKRFVYFVLLPLLLVGLIVFLFIDRWVELGLETAGEHLAGAKVEIDGLHVTLMPIGIRWEKMQVADPDDGWRNLFETRGVEFALNAGQLLRNKYIVESMQIHEFIVGTKRSTDGSIPRAPELPGAGGQGSSFTALARDVLDTTVEKTPLLNLNLTRGGLNADSLIKALDIRTLRSLDSVRQHVLTASRQWETVAGEFELSRKQLTDLEARVMAINPSQLNNVQAVASALATADDAVKGVTEIKTTFAGRKASIERDVKTLSSSLADVEKVTADDFARLKRMAQLPNLNSSGIARMLVGEEMYARALSSLRWIDVARNHITSPRERNGEEKPARLKGQDIRFSTDRAYPKFWVKKALLSGGTDSTTAAEYIHARGEITNITDDQRVTGSPMTASLRGVGEGGRAFSLSAIFDRTKETPFDEYTAVLDGVPLAAFRLGNSGFLDATLSGAKMHSSMKVTVPGSLFDATSSLVLGGFGVRFNGEPKNFLETIVRETLQGIGALNVDLHLWNSGGGFDVALSTDLDSRISERVQGFLGAEYAKAQADLKRKFDDVIAGKRAEVEHLMTAKRAEIEQQLGAFQSLVDQKLAMVEAKKTELAGRLEKEKQGKVNDLLKGIIKK